MAATELEAVRLEFGEVLNDAAGVHAIGLAGLYRFREQVIIPALADHPEAPFSIGTGDPRTPEARSIAAWPKTEIHKRLEPAGLFAALLSQQWVVYVYFRWEHDFRDRFAAAANVSRDEITEPLMGDLRLMRNDIVHKGIATAENCGRCEELKWFSPGETIFISDALMLDFMSRVGLAYHPRP